MICLHCGAPIQVGDKTCNYCGSLTPYGENILFEQKRKKDVMNSVNAASSDNPNAAPAQDANTMPTMKHASLFMMALLYIFTGGIYGPIWYILRSGSLNQLHAKSKFPIGAAYAHLATCVFVLFLDSESTALLAQLVLICMFVVNIWMAFRVRTILREHTASIAPDKLFFVAQSGVATFFFGILYLQSAINKMCEVKFLKPRF